MNLSLRNLKTILTSNSLSQYSRSLSRFRLWSEFCEGGSSSRPQLSACVASRRVGGKFGFIIDEWLCDAFWRLDVSCGIDLANLVEELTGIPA